jgi:hypothetical protein
MNLFFQDPNEIRMSPEEVRLREVKVTPQANSGRVKIYLELTPFIKKPNINVTITDVMSKEVAQINILETMLPKLEFTMHLHKPEQGGKYSVETTVYYQMMPEPSETPVDLHLPDPMIVDRHKATFILPQLET